MRDLLVVGNLGGRVVFDRPRLRLLHDVHTVALIYFGARGEERGLERADALLEQACVPLVQRLGEPEPFTAAVTASIASVTAVAAGAKNLGKLEVLPRTDDARIFNLLMLTADAFWWNALIMDSSLAVE